MTNVAGFEGFAAGVRQPTEHVPGHAAQVQTYVCTLQVRF
jgi:hypothetical protein